MKKQNIITLLTTFSSAQLSYSSLDDYYILKTNLSLGTYLIVEICFYIPPFLALDSRYAMETRRMLERFTAYDLSSSESVPYQDVIEEKANPPSLRDRENNDLLKFPLLIKKPLHGTKFRFRLQPSIN